MAYKIIEACGGDVSGKTIAVLGLAFKPNTDDMRDSPSLTILPILQEKGASIIAFDPEAMEEAKHFFEDVRYASGPYDCIENADIVVILTEWDVFRALDITKVKQLLKTPTIVDLRNVYNPVQMKALGVNYSSIGRP